MLPNLGSFVETYYGYTSYLFSMASIDRHAKVENVKAMIRTAKEYGDVLGWCRHG